MRRHIAFTLLLAIILSLLSGCHPAPAWEPSPLVPTEKMELQFATQFSVEYYEGGYKLISIADGSKFLTVPKNMPLPTDLAEGVVVLQQPIKNIYLAATAAMCLFDALDRLDAIRLSGTNADGWYIDNARQAMEDGRILYAGKYSQPDYELLLGEKCRLAVESTMIGHASEVKEKLEELGIPVLVDHASLEPHPLGRTEWIKLYGALLDCEDLAQRLFDRQVAVMNDAMQSESTGATVSFFYITSTGRAVARKSGDYVSKMIELAGGTYVFRDLGDPDSLMSTITIEMETLYTAAKDADYMIYNSTIGGEVGTLAELLVKSPLLEDFKAVKDGNVWCTGQNMFQEITQLGEMIQSFHKIISGEADDLETLPYLYRLQ